MGAHEVPEAGQGSVYEEAFPDVRRSGGESHPPLRK